MVGVYYYSPFITMQPRDDARIKKYESVNALPAHDPDIEASPRITTNECVLKIMGIV